MVSANSAVIAANATVIATSGSSGFGLCDVPEFLIAFIVADLVLLSALSLLRVIKVIIEYNEHRK